jgi:FkbM family methyltransferase
MLMEAPMPEIMLPNGLKISCLQKTEVPILYEEIQQYLKHGIKLEKGNTVFDVGANIGLFSLWLHQRYNGNLKIYAFEPIPAIFKILESNMQRFGPDQLKAICCGLSSESKTLVFNYYPAATSMSTAYPDNSKEEQEKIIGAALYNLHNTPLLFRCLPPFLHAKVLSLAMNKVFQAKQVNCQLKTLSEVIREYKVRQIDLLKIDAERSELDVFMGIEDEDWFKIRQVVVEVHDLSNRVQKIVSLLKGQGLKIAKVEQQPAFKHSDLFHIYALR